MARSQQEEAAEEGPIILGFCITRGMGTRTMKGVCLGVLLALDALEQLELVWGGQS